MRVVKCDRCGAIIPKDQDSVGYIAINMRNIDTDALVDNNPFEYWDLCDNCLKEIHECITGPKTKQETFEQILDSADAGKKAEKKKQAPKFDVGKAQALRNAHKPITWIAQEMGVSEPTIRKYTVPAPPKKDRPNEWAEHEPDLDPVLQATAEAKPFKVPEEG